MNGVNLRVCELRVISVECTLFIFALYGIKCEVFFLNLYVCVYLFICVGVISNLKLRGNLLCRDH